MSTKHNDPAYVYEQTGVVTGAVITDSPLESLAAQACADTRTHAMGALVRFEGIVRDHDGGHSVATLAYEAHPSAPEELKRVAAEVADAHPVRVYTAHRTGEVPIGELAFLVVVASAHRGEAFTACTEVADRVKTEVPIWKKQGLTSGETQWVGIDE
ncbi:molybdenum cofactor biosynthesis protein MoaE [Corynebacterium sp. HMSC29G08]|uniref:molybdenum cofactor biosynthesis protein MoaE n=1 Tax=Corynebacterium sp. HMSC29G08 TaxID=1581069 RepID=UPI0008A12F0E|nr:molybdenum cofactor biosynthesis protein MoaE [Corynebacterium sp. HMSC29G08]OFT82691.1 molybdopterin converting factor [Corynebacterium sp. HMSC29G08]